VRERIIPGRGDLYRTCVIYGHLEHSPAEHVRRPAVCFVLASPEPPTDAPRIAKRPLT